MRILLCFCCLATSSLQAQHLLGIANSNYAGTNAIYMNPAHIADNRYGFYMSLFSFQTSISNNAFYYKGASLANAAINGTLGQLGTQNFPQFAGNRPRMINYGIQLRTPLSFMVQMSPKHSFAFTTRARGFVSGNQISKSLIDIANTSNIDDPSIAEKQFNGATLNINANAFLEAALSYSRVALNKEKHFLKIGGTIKYLKGASAYAQIKEVDFIIKKDQPTTPTTTEDIIQINKVNMSVGSSTTDNADIKNILKSAGGMGMDIGVVYEFRPNYADYTYKMDGLEGLQDKRANKYKLKVGVSLMDLGGIKYSNINTKTFSVNTSNISLDDKAQNLIVDNPDKPDSLKKALGIANLFGNTFRAGLPTALHITADYCLTNHIYLNLAYLQNMRGKYAIGARQASMLALTPRIEFHGFEFAIPLSLQNNLKTFAFGAAIKLGYLYIGSDNLGGIFNAGKVNGADVYFGLLLPVRNAKKKRDKDLDGISDKLDDCKEVAGVWEFKGCPDTDGDKIQDKEDDCPTEAGTTELKGCPDKDGDGIADKNDACPNEAGSPEFKGCPDKDGDKIIDKEDDCPDTAGMIEFKGCPDTDGDKIQDKEDVCPNVAGLVEYQGCPDTDGDHIQDKEDDCPNEAGMPQFNGCPDTDADGIMDKEDACPTVVGIKANKGCPDVKNAEHVLTEEEKDILKEVFESLEFDYGKATIAKKSQESLKELASVLKRKPQYRLSIFGHTDNVGDAKSNLKLSQDRAKAVKTFLENEGAKATQLVAEGFGDKQPIADNKTEEGRKKNRRVEFKVIK